KVIFMCKKMQIINSKLVLSRVWHQPQRMPAAIRIILRRLVSPRASDHSNGRMRIENGSSGHGKDWRPPSCSVVVSGMAVVVEIFGAGKVNPGIVHPL